MAWLALLSGFHVFAAVPEELTTPPPTASRRVIRHLQELLNLSPEELRQHPAVEVRAVATLFDAGFGLFFVHDGTAGVYADLLNASAQFKPGQAVEVMGEAWQGKYAPYIANPRVKLIGTAPLPEPFLAKDADLLSGRLDAQWVEVAGVVRAARVTGDRLFLEAASGPTVFHAWVQHCPTNAADGLVDSLVSLRGVATAKVKASGRLAGCQLYLNSPADLKVIETAPAELCRPAGWSAKDLMGYRLRRQAGHRVRARGGVAARWSRDTFLMVDASGAVEVQCATNATVNPGDLVDAVGFLSTRPCSPRLEEAVVQRLGFFDPGPPLWLQGESACQPTNQNRIVALEGELLARSIPQPERVVLFLLSSGQAWTASLWTTNAALDLAGLRPGSRLALTGLCRLTVAARQGGASESACAWCDGSCRLETANTPADWRMNLWLRSPTDVRLVSQPRSNFALWCLATATIVLLAGALVLLSRHRRLQVEGLMAQQMALQVEIRDNERYLRRSLEEREQLGRELHDDTIQSIYAVGLNLEDVRRHLPQAPDQARSRLSAAIESLNQVIQNVRSFISGLEPRILDGREFKTALKSLALTAGPGQARFVIEADTVAADMLSPTAAAELLRIAKEAMSNSLRHAQASQITVSLRQEDLSLRLEISDDGVGFDPAAVAAPGQGLRNMAARAAEIGARLKILSAPGAGCRIVVHVSKRNDNE